MGSLQELRDVISGNFSSCSYAMLTTTLQLLNNNMHIHVCTL